MQCQLSVVINKFMQEEFIKVDYKKGSFHGRLNGMLFVNEGFHINYIPSMNISGYGDTPQEAEDMVMESLKDFFESLAKSDIKSGLKELEKLGWKKNSLFKKRLSPSYVDKAGILKEFNLPEETIIKETAITV